MSLGESSPILCTIARILGVDRHTIEKAVRVVGGRTFREHQKARILRRAVSLLTSEPSMSIKQIAVELGYGAFNSFSRFVRINTGKTPSEIRLQMKRKDSDQ